jgi:hypothetical protein
MERWRFGSFAFALVLACVVVGKGKCAKCGQVKIVFKKVRWWKK